MRGLALGCGALVVAAFPEPALWWWAWVALVPVLLLVSTSPTWGEAALRAWLAGAGFAAAFYHWLATQGVLLLVVVAALLGLLWVPVGLVAHRMLGDRPGPRRLGLVVAVNVALTAVVAPSGGTRGARLLAATGAGALLGVAALGGWVALGGGAP